MAAGTATGVWRQASAWTAGSTEPRIAGGEWGSESEAQARVELVGHVVADCAGSVGGI